MLYAKSDVCFEACHKKLEPLKSVSTFHDPKMMQEARVLHPLLINAVLFQRSF